MRARFAVVLFAVAVGLAMAAPLSAAPGVGVKVSQPLPPGSPPYCDVPVTATWKPISGQAYVRLHAQDLDTGTGDDWPRPPLDFPNGETVTSTQGSWNITASDIFAFLTDGSRHRFAFTVSVKDSGGNDLRSGTKQVWLPCVDI